jgi:MarR family transcriptional regulator, temperature-dependent positive regulator of motility
MKRSTTTGLDRSPVHLLHRAYQSAGDIFKAEMKVDGLTPRQLAVLVVVGHNEGLSQTGIMDSTGIDRSTVAELVRRMQGKGLVQRRRTKEDARAYAVKLTDEGRRMLRTAEPSSKAIDARVLSALPSVRRDEFVSALTALVGGLEEMAANPK